MENNNWLEELMDVDCFRFKLNFTKERKNSSGKTQYLRYLNGERLTAREAILACCFECTCGYMDGKADCEYYECPLYPYMPYRKIKIPIYDDYKRKRKGRKLTKEQIKRMQEGRQKKMFE